MLSGFEIIKDAAKSKKKGRDDDAPTQVPMSRSQAGGVRRNPSSDQKKIRRAQTAKTAAPLDPNQTYVNTAGESEEGWHSSITTSGNGPTDKNARLNVFKN